MYEVIYTRLKTLGCIRSPEYLSFGISYESMVVVVDYRVAFFISYSLIYTLILSLIIRPSLSLLSWFFLSHPSFLSFTLFVFLLSHFPSCCLSLTLSSYLSLPFCISSVSLTLFPAVFLSLTLTISHSAPHYPSLPSPALANWRETTWSTSTRTATNALCPPMTRPASPPPTSTPGTPTPSDTWWRMCLPPKLWQVCESLCVYLAVCFTLLWCTGIVGFT